jgi:hypothetical protein
MNEKDILKQSLKEIEEQLNSLEIPSEELKNIFDEIFRKLEMQMNQIGVSNRNLHDGIEEIKNSFTKEVEMLYKKAQENNPVKNYVQYAKIGIQQDSKTSVVKNNIEQIPKELKVSSYEEKLTDVLMQVFEAYGKVLKNQYTPDLSSFRTVNNSLGIYNSMRGPSPEDMDMVIRNLKRQYEFQIYQRIKIDKESVTEKIDGKVESMNKNLAGEKSAEQLDEDVKRVIDEARLNIEMTKQSIRKANEAIAQMHQKSNELEEKLKERVQEDTNPQDITMTLENGDVVELGIETSVIISKDGKRTQISTQELKKQPIFVKIDGGKIVINPDKSMEIIMINGNETVRMSFPKEKLQDLLMGNIKLLNNEKREVKGITEKGIEKMISGSGATIKSVDEETKEVKDSVRQERGDLTPEEFSKLSPGEKDEYRKEFPEKARKLFENERRNTQSLFQS